MVGNPSRPAESAFRGEGSLRRRAVASAHRSAGRHGAGSGSRFVSEVFDAMGMSENLGTRMLLENDRVRIWEHRVGPGETGPMHVHRRPYFSVFVAGSTGDTLDEDENPIEHFTLTAGDLVWYGRDQLPETHALRNTGSDEVLIITTELLEPEPPPPGS
jgi:beta-alanine degradation protein BauB